jgi:hypothetical protein
VRVRKFRSVAEMHGDDPRLFVQDAFERFLRHCARYRMISRRPYPRGVFKFRRLEDAQAARQLDGAE